MTPPRTVRSIRFTFIDVIALALCACAPEAEAPKAAVTEEIAASQPVEEKPAPPQEEELPAASFSLAQDNLGLDFVHFSGADGEKLLPETMGSGAALFDADADGDLDLYVANGRAWPAATEVPATAPIGRFYLMEEGRFRDATEAWNLADPAFEQIGMGVSAADFDGDGDIDLFTTALGPNRLFANERGRFVDVTAKAGVAGSTWKDESGTEHHEWSTSAAFCDLDRDGRLDLFVCNYLEWSVETNVEMTLTGDTPGYARPDLYPGSPCRLYRNRGDGTYAEVTSSAGLDKVPTKALGVSFADVDRDGWADILVANDMQPNALFLNRGGMRFENVAEETGVGFGGNGEVRAGMGIDAAYYSDEETLAVCVGNFSGEPLSFFRRMPTDRLLFGDDNVITGLGRTSGPSLSFATAFLDANLDGRQDLLVINGHLDPDIGLVAAGTSYKQTPQLFLTRSEKGRFRDMTKSAGAPFDTPIVGRGLALGDLDGDGDVDAVVTECGGPAHIWLNDNPSGAKPLRLVLEGRSPNRQAIGAEVRVEGGPFPQTQWVRTGQSYLSQHELALTFGLGEGVSAAKVTVQWPTGETTVHERLELGEMHVLRPPLR